MHSCAPPSSRRYAIAASSMPGAMPICAGVPSPHPCDHPPATAARQPRRCHAEAAGRRLPSPGRGGTVVGGAALCERSVQSAARRGAQQGGHLARASTRQRARSCSQVNVEPQKVASQQISPGTRNDNTHIRVHCLTGL